MLFLILSLCFNIRLQSQSVANRDKSFSDFCIKGIKGNGVILHVKAAYQHIGNLIVPVKTLSGALAQHIFFCI